MFTLHRCTKLPSPVEANAIYIVKDPDDATRSGIYFTGKTANIIFHTPMTADIEVVAQNLIDLNGKGVLPAEVLPEPEDHPGELFNLVGRNIPCWSNGSVWIDLSSHTAGSGGDALDSAVLRRLRDKAVFGISLT